ncbi:zinc-finger associated domain (zf-AD) domain-containing protein [Phthorimaea operculella]|nr:zinc-finger associated domain (zf-AD) domain-containing protein [Phthorimaea operculella]
MSTESATSVSDGKNEDKSLFENIMDSCRLCMEVHKNMKDIFAVEHGKIIERIHFCTGLQLIKDEWLPTNICEKCTENLTIAHSFKRTCLTSNEYYQNLVMKIKTENRDTEFDDHFDNNGDDEKDCKDILKEVLKLSDIKLTKTKKENNSLDRRKHQGKLIKRKNPNTKLAKSIKKPAGKTIKVSKLNCDVCNIDYASKEELAEHRKTVHTEKETFVCELISKVNVSKFRLY